MPTADRVGRATAAISRRKAAHLRNDFERAVYLRTVQDWIIRPQMRTVPGIAGADAIGGYVKQYQIAPDPAKSIAYGISFADIVKAVEANNASRGANYVERNGENYVVRAAGRIEDISEIGEIVVATRGDTPLRVKDLAEVSIGRELRTGSASLDGHEAVLGTALMLVGGNSRTVSAAAAAKIEAINKALPPGIVAKTVLNRTQLVDATITTVAKNLAEGALLVVVILFALLGNFRAALITALVIPAAMLLTVTGMLQAKVSANLMSLGAIDFGLIVDGAVIITENCLRHLANRQHQLGRQLDLPERLETVRLAAKEMVAPSVYGQAVIMLVYIPLLTFSGVEGKMFEPMALTVIIALLVGVRAVADIRSGDDRDRRHRTCAGKAEPAGSRACRSLPVGAHAVIEGAGPRAGCRRCGLCAERHGLSVARTGVQPDARRKEHRDRGAADSQHVAGAIAGHAARSRTGDFEVSAKWRSCSPASARPTSPPIRCRRMPRTPTSS